MERSSATAAEKRKPRLPAATPAEDAEVIALPPEILTATSRFFCDVCRKGFQREQNLQLHRRSHNLPWELKQRAAGVEPRKRVYVCPVPTCAHHDPAKALGDLSGIKKHFCRKHGEKKFNCHGCGKKYAVQSDVRAHMKVCGTKTHHCDCGMLFTKWENFARHKEYCDLLTQAIARHRQAVANTSAAVPSSSQLPPPSLTLSMASPVPSGRQSSEFPGSQSGYSHGGEETLPASGAAAAASNVKLSVRDSPSASSGNIKGGENEVFGGGWPALSTPATQSLLLSKTMASCSDVFRAPVEPTPPLSVLSAPPHLAVNASSSLPPPLSYLSPPPHLAVNASASLPPPLSFLSPPPHLAVNASSSLPPPLSFLSPPPHLAVNASSSKYVASPALSATALLQKAAQIGSTYSAGGSFLRGLGLSMPSDFNPQNNAFAMPMKWNGLAIPENTPMVSSGSSAGLMEMPSPATLIGNQLQTLDFLGVGGGNGNGNGDVPFFGSLGLGEYCWGNPSDRNLGGFP